MSDFDDDTLLLEALESFEKTDKEKPPLAPIPKAQNNLKYKTTSSIESQELAPAEKLTFRNKLMKSLLNNRNTLAQPINSIDKTFEDQIIQTDTNSLKRKQIDIPESINKPVKIIKNASNHFCHNDKTALQNEKSYYFTSEDNNNSSIFLANKTCSNSSLVTYSPVNSLIKKRKFPGPAGILPDWGHETFDKSNYNLNDPNNKDIDVQTSKSSICSQASIQDFTSGPWGKMLFDLEQMEASFKQLIQENSIKWILRRANLKGPASIRKIAFAVFMIKSIDLSHSDAPAVFQDETGEINGTISSAILEEYSNYISSGTVLILRDVTILSPSSFQTRMWQFKKHYLNITLNSVVTIYSKDEEEQVRKVELIKMSEGFIRHLLNSRERAEKKEVIENEENINTEETSLFSKFGQKKQTRPKETPNVHTSVAFKAPFTSKSPSFNRNMNQMSRDSLKTLNSPQQNLSAQSSNTLTKQEHCANVKVQKLHYESLKVNSRVDSEKCDFEQQSRTKCSLNSKTPSSPKGILNTFGDDDELDALLASIDTEAL